MCQVSCPMGFWFTGLPLPSHCRSTGMTEGRYHIQLYTSSGNPNSDTLVFMISALPMEHFPISRISVSILIHWWLIWFCCHCIAEILIYGVGVHGVDRQKPMRVHLVSPIDFALMFKEIDLVEFLWSALTQSNSLITWQSEWHVNYLSTEKLSHGKRKSCVLWHWISS